jgi:hypothetical protein
MKKEKRKRKGEKLPVAECPDSSGRIEAPGEGILNGELWILNYP